MQGERQRLVELQARGEAALSEAEGLQLVDLKIAVGSGAETALAVRRGLRDYYWRKQDKALAEQWQTRHLQRATLLQGARAERAQVTLKDRWFAHGLDAATLAQLVERLRSIPDLRRFDGWPGETIIVNVEGRFYKFGRKFWRMRGARVLG